MSNEQPDNADIEVRQVKVTDPDLSAETNELLTQETQEVLQQSSVRVPTDRPHPAEGERSLKAGPPLNVTGARLMFTVIGSMLVIVALIAVLSGAGWWFLPIVFLGLVVALGWLLRIVLQMTSTREHASPATTAAMEADGVTNPDEFFSAIVDEFTEATDEEISEGRTVSSQENASLAGAEQRKSATQTSGRSDAVGR